MTIAEFRAACMEKFDAASHELNARAKTNIEKYRKGERTLRLIDKDGKPLSGARVKVTQKTHDFKYGANIFLLDEFESADTNRRYREQFAQYFNLATVPFYWEGTEPDEGVLRYDKNSNKIYRRPAPDLCVEYCEQNGILPKLHCLFYDKFIPNWLPKTDSAAMWRLYEKRFAEIAERYAGKMYEFEVSNEMISTYKWKKCSILSYERDATLRMWQMARKYFPNETLVINDTYPPDVGREGYYSPYYLMIENLLRRGATIDKVGVQNHIFCGCRASQEEDLPRYMKFFDPELNLRGLEVLSSFGKPLEITEVTIPTLGEGEDAELLQAEILRTLYTMWFATPLMETVAYWNLADFTAYAEPGHDENKCRAGLFHHDMTPKAAAKELKRLFEEEWHTDETLVADENGCVCFRGFFGEYDMEIDGERLSFGIHKGQTCFGTYKINNNQNEREDRT
ncbi:MAG: endo-1,4-beta-xylanase [Clostridia bacterium]|nr:endo-1,4-beta-xylanase [Clostridia bacterium]